VIFGGLLRQRSGSMQNSIRAGNSTCATELICTDKQNYGPGNDCQLSSDEHGRHNGVRCMAPAQASSSCLIYFSCWRSRLI